MHKVINTRYRLEKTSFTPSLGEACFAYDLKMFRAVVVWLLPRVRNVLAESFFSQQQKLASITQECIPELLDNGFDLDSGQPFLVYKQMQVVTLVKMERLEPIQAFGVISQLLESIALCHENKIVHGCINPANILYTLQGEVKIIGFGLCSLLKLGDLPNVVKFFMSPQQLEGHIETSCSDVYSLGSLLYYLLTHDMVGLEQKNYQGADTILTEYFTNRSISDTLYRIIINMLEPSPPSLNYFADQIRTTISGIG